MHITQAPVRSDMVLADPVMGQAEGCQSLAAQFS